MRKPYQPQHPTIWHAALYYIGQGFARLAGIRPEYHQTNADILNRSDADAIADDWRAVGNDLRTAFKYYEGDKE